MRLLYCPDCKSLVSLTSTNCIIYCACEEAKAMFSDAKLETVVHNGHGCVFEIKEHWLDSSAKVANAQEAIVSVLLRAIPASEKFGVTVNKDL